MIDLQEQAVAAVDSMSCDERSLLLFLEDMAVNYRGLVKSQSINTSDVKLVQGWVETGFVRFSRIRSDLIAKANLRGMAEGYMYVVELNPLSWACAALERQRRAIRSQNDEIVKPSLKHFEAFKEESSPKKPQRNGKTKVVGS